MQTFTLEKFEEKAEKLREAKAFVIEKGIPMPSPKGDNFKNMVVETVKQIEVGDSFVTEIKSSGYIYFVLRKHLPDVKMVTRTENGKLRIWRCE